MKKKYILAAAIVFLLALIGCNHKQLGSSSVTAFAAFADLQMEAQTAAKNGDMSGRLRAAIKMKSLLHDAPDAVEFTAQAYLAKADTQNALKLLNLFAELGQTDTGLVNGSVKRFSGLRQLPQYQSIVEHLAKNQTAVALATSAFTLHDPNVLAEDIDYDAPTRSFLITSVLQKKIIRLYGDGHETDFIKSPSGWPMLAVKIDTIHNYVWVSEVAINGFTSVSKADWGKSAVLCYDLRSGALLKRIEGPMNRALGDMALTRQGDPIVCDGEGGNVYRVVHDSLQLINNMDFISPQTPVILPDQDHVLIPDYVRGIAILSLRTKHVAWLNKDGDTKVALNGVDGVYFHDGTIFLTQNGTSPECVTELQLNKSFTQVNSVRVIERSTATLGDPTHGVVVRDTFYYIANSGWSELDEHGDLKGGHSLTPAKIMCFKL